MKLDAVTVAPPPGALDLLLALGRGENGFGGTPVGDDPGRLGEWLDYCVHLAEAPALSEDFLPQANYWLMDDAGRAVGLLRLNPRLNAQLLQRGGPVGYYVAPAYRNRGYGRAGLRLALEVLRARGVERAMEYVHIASCVASFAHPIVHVVGRLMLVA